MKEAANRGGLGAFLDARGQSFNPRLEQYHQMSLPLQDIFIASAWQSEYVLYLNTFLQVPKAGQAPLPHPGPLATAMPPVGGGRRLSALADAIDKAAIAKLTAKTNEIFMVISLRGLPQLSGASYNKLHQIKTTDLSRFAGDRSKMATTVMTASGQNRRSTQPSDNVRSPADSRHDGAPAGVQLIGQRPKLLGSAIDERGLLLAHRGDRGEHSDIAVVPIGAETTAGRELIVTKSFSAKVSNGHATAKMKNRRIRADWNSADIQVANPPKHFG